MGVARLIKAGADVEVRTMNEEPGRQRRTVKVEDEMALARIQGAILYAQAQGFDATAEALREMMQTMLNEAASSGHCSELKALCML